MKPTNYLKERYNFFAILKCGAPVPHPAPALARNALQPDRISLIASSRIRTAC
jgi:hypothetical protein